MLNLGCCSIYFRNRKSVYQVMYCSFSDKFVKYLIIFQILSVFLSTDQFQVLCFIISSRRCVGFILFCKCFLDFTDFNF